MRQFFFCTALLAICALMFSSCEHDDPVDPIKPRADRTVLLLTGDGHIYDQTGTRIMELPNCEEANEIISDGDDYFVSGKTTKERVGYWKNGKWNTLHVDFINDVEHWTEGIGKWDYYIFLFDYPNILRNSGIFPLEDYENFSPSSHCMSVSEGKCYVIGTDHPSEEGQHNNAILYYERKGKYVRDTLPKPSQDINAAAFTVYAYDRTHTIVGGRVGEEPCLWVDGQLQMLPRIYSDVHDEDGFGFAMASVNTITRINGHIYAAGSETTPDGHDIAILWVDGVPQHLLSGDEGLYWSWIDEIVGYGDDLYALTIEMVRLPDDSTDVNILLWLNGEIIARYHHIDIVNFTVL